MTQGPHKTVFPFLYYQSAQPLGGPTFVVGPGILSLQKTNDSLLIFIFAYLVDFLNKTDTKICFIS